MVKAGTGKMAAGTDQASPKMPGPGQHTTQQVLHQRANGPFSPARFAIGGFAIVLAIGYFTLYSHKKPEATALDVGRVATGTSNAANTRPRN
ncbi:hypothetical protein RJ639_045089 [Escallonia herrerae]|uniref:Transmembrane protein n=2 Tax=Escallonia herrerae TaxID=1293975 RepID=A0AA89B1M6_9ASTE|nr:hypothetical protein RJ639_045089 [Escallonia herrerae]